MLLVKPPSWAALPDECFWPGRAKGTSGKSDDPAKTAKIHGKRRTGNWHVSCVYHIHTVLNWI
jgi:hypothetical protein